jgi:TolB-like protein/tetratricopeptide (TPR) repeat protein
VLALLGTKLVGGWPRLASSLSTPRIGALAVLPLDDLSDRAEEQDYFADGITDELITQLAQLPSLRVISRTSVMQYKGAHKPLPQIARELGVDAVLEGSVTRSEGHVRITAQLIDARSDTHLWSAEYSRETRDILSLQREVTSDIARQIRLQFLVPQKAKLDVARPVDPEAYELFLKGLYFWDQRTIASIKHATDYFKQSTRKDPDFAPAWAYLSTTYCMLEREGADSPQAEYPQALQYVQKALQLDPLSAEAHTAMGCIHNLFEWDWKQAEAEFKKAIELNPNYGLAHQWYSFTLLRIGRNDAAIEEMKRALAVDPTSLRVNMTCAFTMLNARHYREAINQFQAAIELFPQEARLHRGLSEAYEGAGRQHEASQEFENFLSSDSFGREFLRFCQPFDYARCKLRFVGEEAQRELAELERGRKNGDYISPARYASVYLRLGNKTKAIHWLQEAYKQHSSYLLIFRAPEFDILRLEPEFQELVAQVELPQTEQ